MPHLEIYSASVCPYAQRSRLVLLEKGIEFTLIDIDLTHKPADFTQVSPYGKVPVIRYGADRVWESSVINEYLEDRFPEPPLMPKPPGERAIARIWIDFANTKFTPAFYKLLLSQEPQQQQNWAEELTRHLQWINTGMNEASVTGPFWFGQALSLVDVSFYPWFERFPVLTHYRGFELPLTCDRIQPWLAAMRERPSVQATAQSAEFHIQHYAGYASNTVMGTTAQELRQY